MPTGFRRATLRCETRRMVRADHGAIGPIAAGLVAVATAVLAAACGTTPTSAASRTTTSTPPPTSAPMPSSTTIATPSTSTPSTSLCDIKPNPDVTFISTTGLCSVTTHVGVTIHADLAAGYNWSNPASTAAAIEVSSIERPSGGGLDADLYALHGGQAVITATGTVACAPGVACPALALLWRLDVNVTG